MDSYIIEAEGLKKTYIAKVKGKKKPVEAVKGVSLFVRQGEIFGFLGPNGAGKSTTQRMFSTLLKPTGGQARIAGLDLLRQQQRIRACIGYVSQKGGTDSLSTGRENLVLQARLQGIDAATAKERADEYIRRFQMESFVDRRASGYSGGQRRRLDIALGMIHQPRLLLLDEPTTGLDPQSRAYLWEEIRRLQQDGVSVFLSTHYLDEADKLCDTLAIIDDGRIVAQGTPETLKADIGADAVSLTFGSGEAAARAGALLESGYDAERVNAADAELHFYIKHVERALPELLRLLDANRLEAQCISIAKPTLDDVFLKYTGRSLREDQTHEAHA